MFNLRADVASRFEVRSIVRRIDGENVDEKSIFMARAPVTCPIRIRRNRGDA